MPTYAFDRQRYAVETDGMGASAGGGSDSPVSSSVTPLVGQCIQSPFMSEKLFITQWSTAKFPVLADHVINDLIIVPGVFYIHMAYEAALSISKTGAVVLENGSIPSAMLLVGKQAKDTQLVMTPGDGEEMAWKLASLG